MKQTSEPQFVTEISTPLHIRRELDVTSQQVQQLRVLESYDLDHVKNRLLDKGLLPASWIEEALTEFRRYVGLRVVYGPGGPGSGMFSPYVDEVWHQAILFTKEYSAFGEAVIGGFLHHAPNTGDDPVEDEPTDQAPFAEFQEAYERVYGPLPNFWRLHLQGG